MNASLSLRHPGFFEELALKPGDIFRGIQRFPPRVPFLQFAPVLFLNACQTMIIQWAALFAARRKSFSSGESSS
jgi:hypothetical protein